MRAGVAFSGSVVACVRKSVESNKREQTNKVFALPRTLQLLPRFACMPVCVRVRLLHPPLRLAVCMCMRNSNKDKDKSKTSKKRTIGGKDEEAVALRRDLVHGDDRRADDADLGGDRVSDRAGHGEPGQVVLLEPHAVWAAVLVLMTGLGGQRCHAPTSVDDALHLGRVFGLLVHRHVLRLERACTHARTQRKRKEEKRKRKKKERKGEKGKAG